VFWYNYNRYILLFFFVYRRDNNAYLPPRLLIRCRNGFTSDKDYTIFRLKLYASYSTGAYGDFAITTATDESVQYI